MTEAVPILLACAGLLLLNALCVGAEFAIASAPRATIESLAVRGKWIHRYVSGLLRKPRSMDRYLATAQVGITIASIGLGMYGEHRLAAILAERLSETSIDPRLASHGMASAAVLFVLTYFHIVVGEMVPKAVALSHSVRASIWLTPPIICLKYFLSPLVFSMNLMGTLVLRFLRIRREIGIDHYHSPKELTVLVEESRGSGAIGSEAGRLLKDLIEFSEHKASEVMTPRVSIIGLPLGASPDEMRSALRKAAHTRYPVYEQNVDRIVGMVHMKDLLRLIRDDRPLELVRPVAYLPATSSVERVFASMRGTRSPLVVVLDEHGGTAGIVTHEDLFEEVVGEIVEGAEPTTITPLGVDRVRAFGSARLEEIGESLGTPLRSDEVDTISGLVLMLLERPPSAGDEVEFGPIQIRVVEAEGNRAKSVEVALK